MLKTVTIRVSGKVQGVWYRQGTREKARELGITGVVRNRPDGTVWITATGTDKQLEDLITWCHSGPPKARVMQVETSPEILQEFESFEILR
ncbi:MAG: acylphosphatase [Chitinophagaceae bacterium]